MGTVSAIDAGAPSGGLQRNISTFVRMFMAREGLNQQQLGERVGLEQAVVSARLRGVSRWTPEDLTRLAVAFDVHPGVFWTDPKDFTPRLAGISARVAPNQEEPLSTKWKIASAA
jgi:transcriptional regulator with XRE-family HTH domain